MAAHKIRAHAKASDGSTVLILPETIAGQVQCETESGGTIALDELLNEQASEINGLTESLSGATGLQDIPTVGAFDTSHYLVSYIVVTEPGTGYSAGTTTISGIPIEITVNATTGAILTATADTTIEYDTDMKGDFPVSELGGTNGTIKIVSRYAIGDTPSEGKLQYVPPQDPLTQESRVKSLIKETTLDGDNILPGTLTGRQLADDAFQSPVPGAIYRDGGNFIITKLIGGIQPIYHFGDDETGEYTVAMPVNNQPVSNMRARDKKNGALFPITNWAYLNQQDSDGYFLYSCTIEDMPEDVDLSFYSIN